MSGGALGLLIVFATVGMLLTGAPVAFGLGAISLLFTVFVEGVDGLRQAAETMFGGLDDFALVAIPMFTLMGAAVGSSRAGADLYEALDRWLYRVPGGLLVSNLGACAIFAALNGSSPATCAAIGKVGIPEMRKRGYDAALATGAIAAGGTLGILIPPSLTMILYGIATSTSIGRLFMAGMLPGLMLTGLFIVWAVYASRRLGYRQTDPDFRYTLKDKLVVLPKVLPFLAIVGGVLIVLYGGIATPSEAAGVGAALAILLAVIVYRMWQVQPLWHILRDTTRESVMIMMIIGASVLFGHLLASLYVTQSLAEWVGALDVNRWVLMIFINLFLLLAGCFVPPAAIIMMTAPILHPIVVQAGFDPIWFGVILTINMEVGLIHPPVGLNLFVIKGIAPDVPISTVFRGTIPFVLCMFLGMFLLSVFPAIATWLPDTIMGPAR